MDDVRPEYLRKSLSPGELRDMCVQFPELCPMVEEFMAAAQPGDEFWLYDIGAYTGLALLRAGRVVKANTYGHAHVPPPVLVIRWAGGRPTNREILALRQIDPALRDKPVSEVRCVVGDASEWRVGPFPSFETDAVERRCHELGLRTERE